ncbi:hypothetical protein ACIRRA_40020 [Nocardia sp. NPDC101769]
MTYFDIAGPSRLDPSGEAGQDAAAYKALLLMRAYPVVVHHR